VRYVRTVADDFAQGRIKEWLDFPSPAGRSRKLDLVVAEPDRDHGQPDLNICGCASRTSRWSLRIAIGPTATTI
jgi:hypothetical protein